MITAKLAVLRMRDSTEGFIARRSTFYDSKLRRPLDPKVLFFNPRRLCRGTLGGGQFLFFKNLKILKKFKIGRSIICHLIRSQSEGFRLIIWHFDESFEVIH